MTDWVQANVKEGGRQREERGGCQRPSGPE